MRTFNGPRSLYRWQLGLLLLSLPRRLIPRRASRLLGQLLAGGADEPLPYPVRDAHPRPLRSLADQLPMLWGHADVQDIGVSARWRISRHAKSVHPLDTQNKERDSSLPLDSCVAIGYTNHRSEKTPWMP